MSPVPSTSSSAPSLSTTVAGSSEDTDDGVTATTERVSEVSVQDFDQATSTERDISNLGREFTAHSESSQGNFNNHDWYFQIFLF